MAAHSVVRNSAFVWLAVQRVWSKIVKVVSKCYLEELHLVFVTFEGGFLLLELLFEVFNVGSELFFRDEIRALEFGGPKKWEIRVLEVFR